MNKNLNKKAENEDLEERKESCLRDCRENFPMVLEYIYITYDFDDSWIIGVKRLYNEIKQAFFVLLNKTPWFDDKSREMALQKVLNKNL